MRSRTMKVNILWSLPIPWVISYVLHPLFQTSYGTGEAVSTGHLGVIMPREVEQPSDEGQKGPGYPPGFIRQLKNKHVFSKMPTIFDCLVTGNPKPDVEWSV